MILPFLDRAEERRRLEGCLSRRHGTLAVLYGRRRCGKSRLLREALPAERTVYYVGDDREASLQRRSLAAEIGRRIPGFDAVEYPEWDPLLTRYYREAARGSILVLDEFPALAGAGREIPSLIQKGVDAHRARGVHLVLCGSSQRMMQGLVFDRTAPLFGRAEEILRVSPLSARWIGDALAIRDPLDRVEAYAVWGGVPRYWELAAPFRGTWPAVRDLVLNPAGPLRDEPSALLLDDLRDTAQAASILALIGAGCHRLSEIAGRLGKPATALTRPVARLVEMELVRREVPFGSSPKDTKRTAYRIGDPFLRFWFRFAEPARSRIEAGFSGAVAVEARRGFAHHAGSVWEDLVRAALPRLRVGGAEWADVGRSWGTGLDGKAMEIDVVARSADGRSVLLAEAEWSDRSNPARLLQELQRKAQNFPLAQGKKTILAAFVKTPPKGDRSVLGPEAVLAALP